MRQRTATLILPDRSRSSCSPRGSKPDMGQRIASWGLALAVWALAPQPGVAQPASSASTCFEILPAERNVVPASPILLNKCTGSTYVLTRKRSRYEWVPIGRREGPRPVPKPAKETSGRKCFYFDGREFCE